MNRTKFIFLLSIAAFVFTCCTNHNSTNETTNVESTNSNNKDLYKVVVYYPKTDSTKFDMDYYVKNHMPMMARILGSNLHYYEIDNGNVETNNNTPYVAAGSFYINDIKQFNDSVSVNPDSIGNDIPKYTNEKPIIQTFTTKRFGDKIINEN